MDGKLFWAFILAFIALGIAVGLWQLGPAVREEHLRAPVPRETAPVVPGEDLAELVAGNTAFALDLFRSLSEREGNLVLSPYSISLALSLVYAGARGETEHQIAQALHFTLPGERLHPAFNALDLSLQGATGPKLELVVANTLWAQRGLKIKDGYLELLARNYGSGVHALDFRRAPEASRRRINSWVSEHTKHKIEELLPEGSITFLTELVLTNAIYFRGTWEHKFEPAGEEPFRLLDGTEVSVPMMEREGRFGYAAGVGYQAVEVPYVGGRLSFVAILPERYTEFEEALVPERLEEVLEGLEERELKLLMPKFSFESGFELREHLERLGMAAPFSPEADLSGIADGELSLSSVVHRAFIRVTEEGTEAAAATGVIVGRGLIVPLEVRLDRPFLFLVRDRETGAILFLGRVLDPRGGQTHI